MVERRERFIFDRETRQALISTILREACEEHHDLESISPEVLTEQIERGLFHIQRFQNGAVRRQVLTPAEVRKIKAIWVFSGAGTLRNPLKKDEIWRKYPWSGWHDRRRLHYGAWLLRKIAEQRSNLRLDGITDSREMREVLSEYGPVLLYNGIPEENSVVRAVLEEPKLAIPKDKVHLIDYAAYRLRSEKEEIISEHGVLRPIKTTIDQVRSADFSFVDNWQVSDRVAIVSHAPHFIRILPMLAKYPFQIPSGVDVQIFPLSILPGSELEYTKIEIRGWLYYMHIAQVAAPCLYPHIL